MRAHHIIRLATVAATLMLSPMAGMAMAAEPEASASAGSVLVLGGVTRQHLPVVIELSRNGRQIKRASAALSMDCSAGGGIVAPDLWTRVRVSKRGAFRTTYRDAYQEKDGTRVQEFDSFAGKVNRRRTAIRGRWSLRLVFTKPDGAVDSCDSGSVRISARR
jgi:hypothetical protein